MHPVTPGKGRVTCTITVERLEETTANIFNHYDTNYYNDNYYKQLLQTTITNNYYNNPTHPVTLLLVLRVLLVLLHLDLEIVP